MTDVTYRRGSIHYLGNEKVTIERQLGFYDVLVKKASDSSRLSVPVAELAPRPPGNEPQAPTYVENLDPQQKAIAERWLAAITPILEAEKPSLALHRVAGLKMGVSARTVYRKVEIYRTSGRLSSLVPTWSDGGRGRTRIDPQLEAILQGVIESYYLQRSSPSVNDTFKELNLRCINAGVEPCHYNTLRNRILALDEYTVAVHRDGRRATRRRYAAKAKHFTAAERPLARVQMDHTLCDIFLVDDVERMPIGRPWLTIAIDEYSRMVVGFYVSLDPVGTLSTGQCLFHSLVTKEPWLAKIGVKGTWPIRGKPRVLMFDCAKEFRGRALREACSELGIIHEFRPVKRPEYGAYIERLMGTLSKEMKILPGKSEREVRDLDRHPPKDAVFTLKEFEVYLAEFICNVYHQRTHGGIGCSPAEKAREGFFGPNGQGIPDDYDDKEALRMLLLPLEDRKIQPYGIKHEGRHYWSPELHRYFTPDKTKRKDFRFRYDPRVINRIFVWLPDIKQYLAVPLADRTIGPVSIWEWNEAKATLSGPKREKNEREVYKAMLGLRARTEAAAQKTSAAHKLSRARTKVQRRRHHAEAAQDAPQAPVTKVTSAEIAKFSGLSDSEDIKPFSDRRTVK